MTFTYRTSLSTPNDLHFHFLPMPSYQYFHFPTLTFVVLPNIPALPSYLLVQILTSYSPYRSLPVHILGETFHPYFPNN